MTDYKYMPGAEYQEDNELEDKMGMNPRELEDLYLSELEQKLDAAEKTICKLQNEIDELCKFLKNGCHCEEK